MKRTVKTAGIQFAPSSDRRRNLERAGTLISLAAQEGAKIICMPQLFNSLWFLHSIEERNFSLAETSEGPTVTFMREVALERQVVLICPIFEKDGESFFNTAFVIGPDGEIIGRYRKVHVPQIPLWEEKAYFMPGNLGFPVFDTPFAKIGVQICWDTFFPEGFRILALKGAEVIFTPTASAFYHSRMKWERALSAAAHANGVFVFRVNRVGRELHQEFYGRSFCVRPDGDFLDMPSGQSEGIVLADLDLKEINLARNEWVFLRDRRPGDYGEILK